MTFANPLGLLGLFTLPVIVGLHLHLERNRRAVVSSLFLWAFLDAKLQGQRPKQLRFTWLLLLDLLIASFLSLALAQPQLEITAAFAQDAQVLVLVDTSTSMLANDVAPSRIDLAKEEVYGLIDAVGQNGIVTVVSMGSIPKVVGDSRELSDSALKAVVAEMIAGGTGVEFEAGLAVAQAAISETREVVVHVITDGAFDVEIPEDLPFPIQWHFIGDEAENMAVADPQLLEVDKGKFQLLVNLINSGSEEKVTEVKVITDGQETNRMEPLLSAESKTPFIVNIPGSVDYVQVELSGSDALGIDNFAGVGRAEESVIRVALVANRPEPLDRAVMAATNVELDVISPNEYNYASDYDLTIFRGYLPEDWPDGVVFAFDIPVESELLPASGTRNIEDPLEIAVDPLTDGLVFSGVRWQNARGLLDSQTDFSTLISAGDTPILLERELERGQLILFTPFLEVGNLTMHPVFPLLLSNVIESAREFRPEQEYSVGELLNIPIDALTFGTAIKDPGFNDVQILPNGKVALVQFGQYSFQAQEQTSESEMVYFGVNAGDQDESNISPRDWAVELAEANLELDEDDEVVFDLTPWLLCLVVGLLLVEAWRAWR